MTSFEIWYHDPDFIGFHFMEEYKFLLAGSKEGVKEMFRIYYPGLIFIGASPCIPYDNNGRYSRYFHSKPATI